MADGNTAVLNGMNRQLRFFFFEYVVKPPLVVVGFIFKGLYWITYGWWGEGRFFQKQLRRLEVEIRDLFWFLFSEHSGEIVQNGDIGHLARLQASVVTVSVGNLLVRFVEWRDEQQVHIASKQSPSEWYGLLSALRAMDQEVESRIFGFRDAADLLHRNLKQLEEAFSPVIDPELRKRVLLDRDYDRAATRQLENEINRRLYG